MAMGDGHVRCCTYLPPSTNLKHFQHAAEESKQEVLLEVISLFTGYKVLDIGLAWRDFE
jgi:cyclopropane fatty-acyl-phospholipid synthase-like methyltransferase